MTTPTAVDAIVSTHTEPPILDDGLAAFHSLRDELRPLLDRLWTAQACPRAQHGRGRIPKQPGVYLFADLDGRPVYVGQTRNLNRRLGEHCRPKSRENQASFAFNIAKKTATHAGVSAAGFRAQVAVQEDFATHFTNAKEQVAAMPVRFVVESDPELRTVFEVYATLAFGTQEFNSHETH